MCILVVVQLVCPKCHQDQVLLVVLEVLQLRLGVLCSCIQVVPLLVVLEVPLLHQEVLCMCIQDQVLWAVLQVLEDP
jgi:hypothetical protein